MPKISTIPIEDVSLEDLIVITQTNGNPPKVTKNIKVGTLAELIEQSSGIVSILPGDNINIVGVGTEEDPMIISGTETGAKTFVELEDTPSDYGLAGQYLQTDGSGQIFYTSVSIDVNYRGSLKPGVDNLDSFVPISVGDWWLSAGTGDLDTGATVKAVYRGGVVVANANMFVAGDVVNTKVDSFVPFETLQGLQSVLETGDVANNGASSTIKMDILSSNPNKEVSFTLSTDSDPLTPKSIFEQKIASHTLFLQGSTPAEIGALNLQANNFILQLQNSDSTRLFTKAHTSLQNNESFNDITLGRTLSILESAEIQSTQVTEGALSSENSIVAGSITQEAQNAGTNTNVLRKVTAGSMIIDKVTNIGTGDFVNVMSGYNLYRHDIFQGGFLTRFMMNLSQSDSLIYYPAPSLAANDYVIGIGITDGNILTPIKADAEGVFDISSLLVGGRNLQSVLDADLPVQARAQSPDGNSYYEFGLEDDGSLVKIHSELPVGLGSFYSEITVDKGAGVKLKSGDLITGSYAEFESSTGQNKWREFVGGKTFTIQLDSNWSNGSSCVVTFPISQNSSETIPYSVNDLKADNVGNIEVQMPYDFACSDETTELVDGIVYSHRISKKMANIQRFDFGLMVAQVGAPLAIDVLKNGSSVFSTIPRIDATEFTTVTASVQQQINFGQVTFNAGDSLQVLIATGVGTGAVNLKGQAMFTP